MMEDIWAHLNDLKHMTLVKRRWWSFIFWASYKTECTGSFGRLLWHRYIKEYIACWKASPKQMTSHTSSKGSGKHLQLHQFTMLSSIRYSIRFLLPSTLNQIISDLFNWISRAHYSFSLCFFCSLFLAPPFTFQDRHTVSRYLIWRPCRRRRPAARNKIQWNSLSFASSLLNFSSLILP